MSSHDRAPRGRGAGVSPPGRFETRTVALDPEEAARGDDGGDEPTLLFEDRSRSVLSRNDSPDLPFEWSLNPYRGCEHGCSYCYARPYHEYLGYSAGLDFETRIVAKPRAPELLARALRRPAWRPTVLHLSGVTDPYQPVERRLGITRACLEVLHRFRHPVSVTTKGALVERDLDLLAGMASWGGAFVAISLTTLDAALAAALEPRAAGPQRRLMTVRRLAGTGVPVHVSVAPVVPGLNEHEIPRLLTAAAESGARSAGYALLRLPGSVATVFEDWLDRHASRRKDTVLRRLRRCRGGRLTDARFGRRFRGRGALAEEIADLFDSARRRAGLEASPPPLCVDRFTVPHQAGLFDECDPSSDDAGR